MRISPICRPFGCLSPEIEKKTLQKKCDSQTMENLKNLNLGYSESLYHFII